MSLLLHLPISAYLWLFIVDEQLHFHIYIKYTYIYIYVYIYVYTHTYTSILKGKHPGFNMYIYTLYEKSTITKLHHMIKCNAFIPCWFNFKKEKVPKSHQCMYTLYGKSTKTQSHVYVYIKLYRIIYII